MTCDIILGLDICYTVVYFLYDFRFQNGFVRSRSWTYIHDNSFWTLGGMWSDTSTSKYTRQIIGFVPGYLYIVFLDIKNVGRGISYMNMIEGGLDGVHEKHIYDDMHVNTYHL